MLASCIYQIVFFYRMKFFLHCYLYLIFNFSTMCSLANFFQWCSPPDHARNSTKKHVFFITFLLFHIYVCATHCVYTYNIQTNINLHNIFLVEQLLSCGTTTTTTRRLVICTQLNDLSKSSILCEAFYIYTYIHNICGVYMNKMLFCVYVRVLNFYFCLCTSQRRRRIRIYIWEHIKCCVNVCVLLAGAFLLFLILFLYIFYCFFICIYTAILFVFFPMEIFTLNTIHPSINIYIHILVYLQSCTFIFVII